MALAEIIAPITQDLRQPDNNFDIIKGIEYVNVKDEVMDAGVVAAGCSEGDWLVKDSTGLSLPTVTAVPNTFPVWVGDNQYDSVATGHATIITNGHFIYRTTKYVAGSYVEGQNLTVKNLGGGEKVPSAAGGSDPVLCRVYTAPDVNGVMEIIVLDR